MMGQIESFIKREGITDLGGGVRILVPIAREKPSDDAGMPHRFVRRG